MNIRLRRYSYTAAGIFSVMYDENGQQIAECLEHAYNDDNDGLVPKVAEGKYTCIRHPPNRFPYETFTLTNVPDFQGNPVIGILIHIGNYQKDSSGCILIGMKAQDSVIWGRILIDSGEAFRDFMNLQKDADSFEITIEKNV